jgi:hypothetical protein
LGEELAISHLEKAWTDCFEPFMQRRMKKREGWMWALQVWLRTGSSGGLFLTR